jgi:hypothetical protein
MTITQEITRKETVVKEIELPYYSKNDNTYFRINEDESVLKVFVMDNYANITYSCKGYSAASYFREAVSSEPCSKKEMETVIVQALYFMEQGIGDLKKKKANIIDLDESLYRTY